MADLLLCSLNFVMTFMKNVLTCCLTLFPACLLTRALTYILTEAVTYSSLTYVPTNVVTYFLMCYLMLFGNLDVAFSMAAVNIRCATGIFSFGSIGFGSGTREAVYGINCGVVFAVHERGFASVLDSRTPVSVFRSCLLECAALESCEVGPRVELTRPHLVCTSARCPTPLHSESIGKCKWMVPSHPTPHSPDRWCSWCSKVTLRPLKLVILVMI